MLDLSLVQKISIWVVPVILGITVHEVAHGWIARKLGDNTAFMLGRLTLNPLKHIDPMGTILIPGMLLLLQAGFIFGYAKPVPINWKNLKQPKRDMALVAAAGPVANLLMAIGWALLLRLGVVLGDNGLALVYMGVAGISINGILMILNLLPLPPLDGGRVLTGLLPGPIAYKFSRIEPYGFFYSDWSAGDRCAGCRAVAVDQYLYFDDGACVRIVCTTVPVAVDGAHR